MHRLRVHPDHVAGLLQHAQSEAAISQINPHALMLLQDVLRSTFFQLDGLSEVATAHRGTRPGDPIGDIAFNILMAVLMKEVTENFHAPTWTWEGAPASVADFSQHIPVALNAWAEIAYVDDLAVLLRGSSNEQLQDMTHAVLHVIIAAAHKRGLELTYGSGKTEVLWQLRGPRTRFHKEALHNAGGCIRVKGVDPSEVSVPVVLSYRHLGTWFHGDAKPMHAIRDRIAAARKAWGPLVRPFFSKPAISMQTKVQVFESLVMPRFQFNAHVWSFVSSFGLQAESGLDDWIAFVSVDDRWKGRLKRAIASCKAYRHTHAATEIWHARLSASFAQWGVDFSQAHAPDDDLPWTCDLCDRAFANKVALSMHAVKAHGYQTLVRHYAIDGVCPACSRDFHNRARLCAHLRTAESCLQCIRAVFPPLTVAQLQELNEIDRQHAQLMKSQGRLPPKAQLPVVRATGPVLPPSDSHDAAVMYAKWSQRTTSDLSCPFEQLVGQL
eukprot:s2039_g17.t2